jgi:MFS family permease
MRTIRRVGALPRPVKALGLVSLLTDASSEMIYPLLPAFLTGTLRAGPAFLGVLEGAAEAVASLVKFLAGRASDRLPRRKVMVVAGYGLSSAVRPLVALASAPWHVLAVRLADRVGKGVRSAPRDALLAEATPPGERGRAFGFHRAMDHAGAVIGPLLATAVLWLRPDVRLVFALAALPALASLAVLVFGVREPPRSDPGGRRASPAPGRRRVRPALVRYLAVLAIFTLGNSSDAFLLLRAQEAGVSLAAIPALWAFHHLVKAAAGTHGGGLADRWGPRRAIVSGWAVYAAAYAGFAVAAAAWQIWALFAVYGLFYALTEGAERALVADLCDADTRGHAFGLFHAVTGGMLLPASLVTGVLWQSYGPAFAFGLGAALAAMASAALAFAVPSVPGGEGAAIPSDDVPPRAHR